MGEAALDLQFPEHVPPWAVRTWGLTVACGEHQHDRCGGTRLYRLPISGDWREIGPCTCVCHKPQRGSGVCPNCHTPIVDHSEENHG